MLSPPPLNEANKAANELYTKIRKGDDCEEDVRSFFRNFRGITVPDQLVISALGNRKEEIPPCPKVLRALLEYRADPNANDAETQSAAMHTACWNGSVQVVRLLIEFRANIEVKDSRMSTPPLNTALAAGNAKVCLELLNQNASVTWKHTDGATPLHVATAWIASAHNANLRMPPIGEEPRAVIAMMLHNGVDPTQTEGMSKSATRSTGMTPLEAYRRDIAQSPWRTDAHYGQRFDRTARTIHTLLEQGEKAMRLKQEGNKAFGDKRYDTALECYAKARDVWVKADIRGHHTAVLWSNSARCFWKEGKWDECTHACEKGLAHYCSKDIKKKLEDCLDHARAEAKRKAEAVAEGKAVPPPPAAVEAAREALAARKAGTKLQDGFLESGEDAKPLYDGPSEQGKVHNPGPFICHFEDAKEAGFVDGVDGKKDREKKELQALDEQLVKEGLMARELLDDPKDLDLINRLPPEN